LVYSRLFNYGRINRKGIGEHEESSRTIHKAKLEDKLQKIRFSTSEEEAIPQIHCKRRKRAKIKDFLLKKEICKEESTKIIEKSKKKSN
jgi:hypothetical protein